MTHVDTSGGLLRYKTEAGSETVSSLYKEAMQPMQYNRQIGRTMKQAWVQQKRKTRL